MSLLSCWLRPSSHVSEHDPFVRLFRRYTELLATTIPALHAFFEGGDLPAEDRLALYRKIEKLEHEGDDVIPQVLSLADDRNIFPHFRGSDLRQLAKLLDDLVDEAEKASHAVVRYRLQKIPPRLAELCALIQEAVDILIPIINDLLPFNRERLDVAGVRIAKIEHAADALRDECMGELFGETSDNAPLTKAQYVGDKLLERLEGMTDIASRISVILSSMARKDGV